ncbi:Lipase domain protein [Gracilaria domingensis]|nr:Lipase domain protein [Gracilaria domingensis]
MNEINKLWQLAKNPDTPLSTLSMMTSVNDLLSQLLDETLVFPDEPPICIPTTPTFDPVLGLQLAAYAFRAYLEPSEAAYREIVVSSLPKPSGEKVYNHLAFPDTSFIASSASGLFMIQLTGDIEDSYLTATVNNAISLDLAKLKHITILRCIHNHHEESGKLHDVLTLDMYNSREDYASSAKPTYSASIDLREMVLRAIETGDTVHGKSQELRFAAPNPEKSRSNSMQFSWPSDLGLRLPSFPFSSEPNTKTSETEEQSHVVSIQVSFVPFEDGESIRLSDTSDMSPLSSSEKSNGSSNLVDIAQKALDAFQTAVKRVTQENEQEELNLKGRDRRVRDIVREVLRSKLPVGTMPKPSDWRRFIVAATNLYNSIEDNRIIHSTSTLSEQLEGSLFVESMSTDTQVWLYRDVEKKNLIVSFRGTEQVKWKDFFTDAQTFLQRWVPGEDIDLTIKTGITLGLETFVPGILPTSKVAGSIPEDAIAVHYGFLRAYSSVQTVLLRYIRTLTANLEEDYSIYFTGHSLGGALAIVAAADFVARHNWDNVCCMSYGAPKVGNVNFARRLNELVPNSFRVVNDEDLVSRMPRSMYEGNAVSRYKHSGRTVLLNDRGDYWIEGMASSPYPNGKTVFDVLHERCVNLSDLLEMEQRLWDNLLTGKSVQQHMVSLPVC